MSDASITREDIGGRTRVDALASSNPREALTVARAIRHPWYRCQSLAKVAEHWGTNEQRMEILREALESAQMQTEINRIVTVSSWPLRVMVRLDVDVTATYLAELVELANSEPHSLRRADALFALATCAYTTATLQAIVIPSLVQALLQGHGWRIDRLIRFSAPMVKSAMPKALEALVAHHKECRKKQLLIESLAKPDNSGPGISL